MIGNINGTFNEYLWGGERGEGGYSRCVCVGLRGKGVP